MKLPAIESADRQGRGAFVRAGLSPSNLTQKDRRRCQRALFRFLGVVTRRAAKHRGSAKLLKGAEKTGHKLMYLALANF
jgi:hypothetical protein